MDTSRPITSSFFVVQIDDLRDLRAFFYSLTNTLLIIITHNKHTFFLDRFPLSLSQLSNIICGSPVTNFTQIIINVTNFYRNSLRKIWLLLNQISGNPELLNSIMCRSAMPNYFIRIGQEICQVQKDSSAPVSKVRMSTS